MGLSSDVSMRAPIRPVIRWEEGVECLQLAPPAAVRRCANEYCRRRLAQLNSGIHCFSCEVIAAGKSEKLKGEAFIASLGKKKKPFVWP